MLIEAARDVGVAIGPPVLILGGLTFTANVYTQSVNAQARRE